jgi:hypothetical protein
LGYSVELLLGTYRFIIALDPYPLLHNVELLALKMEALYFSVTLDTSVKLHGVTKQKVTSTLKAGNPNSAIGMQSSNYIIKDEF